MGLFGRDTYGAKTKVFAGGSATVLAAVGDSRRRAKLLIVGALVAVVVAGVVVFVVLRVVKANAAERVVDRYGTVSRCLLGDGAGGKTASVQYRERQLTSLTKGELERGEGKNPWPVRCAKSSLELVEALQASALSEDRVLVGAAEQLAEFLSGKDPYWGDISAPLDAFFAATARAGLPLVQKADVPEPPAPAKTLDADSLAAAASPLTKRPVDLGTLPVEAGGVGLVRVLIEGDENEPARLCAFSRSTARCDELTGAVARSSGLELRGSSDDDAPPLVFVASGKQGAWRGSTHIDARRALTGYSSSAGPGHVLVAGDEGEKVEVVVGPGERARRLGVSLPGGLKVSDVARNAYMLGTSLFIAATDKDGALVLTVGSLGADGASLGRFEEIGPLGREGRDAKPAAPTRFSACRTADGAALRIDVGIEAVLVARDGDHWSAPVKLGRRGGTLGCVGAEAVVTRIDPGDGPLTTSITQMRCGGGACKPTSLKLQEMLTGEAGLAPAPVLTAANVGSKAAVAWLAGQRGGVRLRVEALGALAQAPDVIVYDDLVQGGSVRAQTTLSDMRLLPGDGFALLLLATPNGLFALRVGADGKVEPLRLS